MKNHLQRSITLKHLLVNNQQCIGFQFNADKVIEALIEQLPDPKWSHEFRMAYILNNKDNLDLVFEKFRGVAWVNCNNFFKDKVPNHENNEIDIKWFRKRKTDANYRKCPEEYLKKLELKRYANNTVKSYVNCFETFINHYKDQELLS